MSDDKFVTVMTFNQSFEAQLAKNLLESEGIASMLSGEITADVLPLGQAGGGDQIALQVREEDAQRAAGLLATVAAAKLDKDWEDEAESGVWLCSICGEPISNRLSVCYSCQTPREGIRAGAPRHPEAIQADPATLPTGEEVQRRDDIRATPPPAIVPPPPAPAVHEERDEPLPSARGDELARQAFRACALAAVPFLMPLAWYYLLRALFTDEEMSPKGRRQLNAALVLNGLFAPLYCGVLGWWIRLF